MNRVVHFEIYASNPERAIVFYKSVFGWTFEKWGEQEYWMVMTAPKGSDEMGVNGGLMPRPNSMEPKDSEAVSGFVCTMQVENIDDTIEKILKEGGKIAMEKFAIPEMAWQAYYRDTEGNIFGIHQPDPNAK
ncbi:MAG: glyoxalase [Candidatus Harrisonbacteria bacterium CG10_big_fil_rev_8_21_14_0_10_40_38]|uniref:Glyoxalase n=1 Tax=Candidatus Harrisonbacteria bacterium CG10_big_fil_rev_8_21_14_0_10_40_38 TaxID=1974583 RepID=A0A2H0USR8_9BACT|nr:MAG: glyoxalase [Candidatus Harrisonbacteria bacterium CG10_big_fil_rev_8_21_14_0_10_40_38]